MSARYRISEAITEFSHIFRLIFRKFLWAILQVELVFAHALWYNIR